MAERIELKAQAREGKGSGKAGRLRRDGWVPGVLYGPDLGEPLPFKVQTQELRRVLASGGERGVLYLTLEGAGESKEYPVMIKDVQRDKLKDNIIHLDLYQVSATRKVTTTVPVQLLGTASGVQARGVLQHLLWEVEIECLPQELPDALEADISHLEIGDVLTVGDLVVPEGVEVLTPAEDVVVSILAPQVEEPEEEAEEAAEKGAPEAAEEPAAEEGEE